MLHINKIAIYIYTHTPCIRTLYRKTGPDLEPPANNIFFLSFYYFLRRRRRVVVVFIPSSTVIV